MNAQRLLNIVSVAIISLPILFAESLLAGKPKIIHNEERGLWHDNSAKGFDLIADLIIGREEGEDHEIFGRIFDIVTDSRENIYIVDNGFSRIQKYDCKGTYIQTIGGVGEGPGDYSFPTAIGIDKDENVYVGGGNRISVFDSNGNFVSTFRHGIPDFFIRKISVGSDNGIYISCLDIIERKIIHKYSFSHEHLISFKEFFI